MTLLVNDLEIKKAYVLNQLISKGILTTKSGRSVYSLSYRELITELALVKAKRS